MSVITSYFTDIVLYKGYVPYDTYVGIDVSAYTDNLPPGTSFTTGEAFFVSVTDNLPITVYPASSLTSYKYPTFYEDYYNRIHINPGVIDLGNMLSVQSRNVEVWSAYESTKLLTSVTQQATDGITLNEPLPSPTVFKAYEFRTYSVNISTNGPPILDANFIFNFPSETPVLHIIGRRVVLWPFIPETGYEETLSWKTDILGSFNNEQRIALRAAPRQAFSHTFLLDNSQFSKLKAISSQWAHRIYGIAVWSDVSKVNDDLPIGSTFIPFDTSNADYRDNDLVVLWSSDVKVEALEILTVAPNGVNLKLPTTAMWSDFYIAPLRFARTPTGLEFNRTSNEYIGCSGTFEVTLNKDLASEGVFPIYRSKVVLLDRSAVVGGITERIARTIDSFDNGSGPIEIDIKTNWVRHLQQISFIKNSKSDIWKLRKWIHARKGKQKSFWLPSWNKDLELTQDVSNTSTTITVKPIGYSLFYGVKDLMIRLKTGTDIFLRVLSATTDINGDEILALDSQVGYIMVPNDIEFICFLSHCRLDTDQITVKHVNYCLIEASIIVSEIPE